MIKWIVKEEIAKQKPRWAFEDGFDLKSVTRAPSGDAKQRGAIAEFIGTGDLASQWMERQRYEVDAGRDEEPLLYQSIYDEIVDANLPETVTIYKIGPGGVVFEQVYEGGEAKFVSLSSSDQTVSINQYACALEYSKKMRMYNRLWDVALIERQAGIAHNALLNHLHLYPIISYSYAADNQTAASSTGTALVEKYLRTIEDAITASRTDTSNPRRGPYDLLVAVGDLFMVERALSRVPQEGVQLQSSAIGMIQNVIAYDGWTGTRGLKDTTYTGVTAGTAYLISKSHRYWDFQSWVKQSLEQVMGNADVSRFIEAQVVWDLHRGVYANPLRAVEEITWPTS
jgi:hypothetical protein